MVGSVASYSSSVAHAPLAHAVHVEERGEEEAEEQREQHEREAALAALATGVDELAVGATGGEQHHERGEDAGAHARVRIG